MNEAEEKQIRERVVFLVEGQTKTGYELLLAEIDRLRATNKAGAEWAFLQMDKLKAEIRDLPGKCESGCPADDILKRAKALGIEEASW